MQINITTIARRPQYLATTLKNLLGSDWKDQRCPVNIVLGSDDSSHVPKEYLADPTFTVVPWKMTSTGKPRQDCSLTHVSALRYGDGPTVILEDDVCFTQDWMASLLRTHQSHPTGRLRSLPQPGSLQGRGPWRLFRESEHIPVDRGAGNFLLDQGSERGGGGPRDGKNHEEMHGPPDWRDRRPRFKLFLTGEVLIRHIGQCSCF